MATIKTGWLKDNSGDKFAPKTLSSQVINSEGDTLESVVQAKFDEINALIENGGIDPDHSHVVEDITDIGDYYYDKTYIDTNLATKDEIEHNHDEVYAKIGDSYTKDEMDSNFALKSELEHNHDLVYAKIGDSYTKAEEDAFLVKKLDVDTYTAGIETLEGKIATGIETHNTSTEAHADIRTEVAAKVAKDDIVTDLETSDDTKVLAASQGAALKTELDTLTTGLDDGTVVVNTATKLSSSTGSEAQPIYFKDGQPATTTYTLDLAGENAGLVQSGGDVTIANGVITVNDDSHAHIIDNVDGLQNALDTKVPQTRTINGESLESDITLDYAHVGALSDTDPVGAGTLSIGRVAEVITEGEGDEPDKSNIGANSIALGLEVEASGIASFAEGYGTIASGEAAHAEGYSTEASGTVSHAEGWCTVASGEDSHAEGHATVASGVDSHSEGCYTVAKGDSQHVQGKYNIEDGGQKYAHIVGNGTGDDSRSNAHTLDWNGNAWFKGDVYIGGTSQDDTNAKKIAGFSKVTNGTTTIEADSVADTLTLAGSNVTITPDATNDKVTIAVADGSTSTKGIVQLTDSVTSTSATTAATPNSVRNAYNLADSKMNKNNPTGSGYVSIGRKIDTTIGLNSVAIGEYNTASGSYSVALGYATKATAWAAFAEGAENEASGSWSHAEGYQTVASDAEAHAEGSRTVASATSSHAEGSDTRALGAYSHAEGERTTARGYHSHAEGKSLVLTPENYLDMENSTLVFNWELLDEKFSLAKGGASHVEGYNCLALGHDSHAEGYQTVAQSDHSHSEGAYTRAIGTWSHAEGNSTEANTNQHAQGHYNKEYVGGNGNGIDGSAFIIGNGGSDTNRSNAFRVHYNGNVYAQSSTLNTGADYAEYFEWQDSNPDVEDRRGYFVTLDGEQIKIAEPDDYILGIISGQPAVIGNGDEDWRGRYILDEFGAFITEEFEYEEEIHETVIDEETGEARVETKTVTKTGTKYKENPDYDSSLPYVQRADRPEWSAVGMMGVLSVRDDGTCQVNGYCKVAEGGIATASDSGYRVIKRINDHIVQVVFR